MESVPPISSQWIPWILWILALGSLGIGRAQCGLAASKRTDVDTGDHRVDLDACAGSALEIWRTGG